MTIQTAIYLRVSTEEQTEKYGLAVQLAQCEAMAIVKGWDVAGVFTDEGISGTKDESDRPGLQALLSAVDAGQVQAVIVAALDRLGRSTRLILRLVDKLAGANVAIVSCKESIDTTTPTGQFVLTVFAALAQLERDTIVKRTTDGRNERGKRDGEKGGRVPMGYERVFEGGKATGAICVNEGEAAVVRDVFDWRTCGRTLTAIADELNRRGILTRRGRIWHASSVRELLLNADAYRGLPRNGSGITWPVILQ
jgi:site-specific DNA recombinase